MRSNLSRVVVLLGGLLLFAATAYAQTKPTPVAMPEPATGLLLITGVGATWAAFRRRRSK